MCVDIIQLEQLKLNSKTPAGIFDYFEGDYGYLLAVIINL